MSQEQDRAFEQLFRHAAPRPHPPLEIEREVKAALLEEWDAVAGRRVRWRRTGFVAAAVALIAVTVGVLLNVGVAPDAVVVARVERVSGEVTSGDERSPNRLVLGGVVTSGAIVSTGQGQIALRLSDGGSLRLAPGTRLTMVSARETDVATGMLYFDSERGTAAPAATQVVVRTPAGIVRDVGTQFLVRLDGDRLDVGVRDGQVALTHSDGIANAGAGERLIVDVRSDRLQRGSIDSVGAEWEWAEALAPPYEIEGSRLSDFLDWVAAQTGRNVAYVDANAEAIARQTTLRGSIDLDPMSKLAAVLATTDLTYTLEGATILIGVK
ncbi:MAG TPA: FecR family protein [Gammaproteobacteria bacterium]|jgi:ferric-dicitrate binding protein FerR (iron transport regulator)